MIMVGRRYLRPLPGGFGLHPRRTIGLAVVLVVLLSGPLWSGSGPAAGTLVNAASSPSNQTLSGTDVTPSPVSGSLVVTNQSFELSPQFFGVNVHAVGTDNQSLAALVNATPFVSFRFSPAGEATNQVDSIVYSPNGVPSSVYSETDAQFVTWCRWVECRATMMVPAEIDNAKEAAATVRYVEQTLGFHPEYWAIGNEPQQWIHFGIPWTKWRSNDDSTPTPAQYAVEVRNYVSAMRAVDPKIRIIGIESVVGGTLSGSWIKDLVEVDGPNLTAVAYHAYPLGAGTGPASLASFYAALRNPTAFPLNYPATTTIVHDACPSCHILVFVDELNAGLGGNFASYLTHYPEVPFIAAVLITAMREDVRHVLFFDLEDLDGQQPYGLTTVGAGSRPSYLLYSDILNLLASGRVVRSSIHGGPEGVYSVLTKNATSTSLFVVNTNLTHSLSMSLPGSVKIFSTSVTDYGWTFPDLLPSAPLRVTHPTGSWTVPPQSLVLLVWN
jgi:hypothetical protein